MPNEERDGEFVQSLERGLAVIQAFSAEHPQQTLADVARRTGLTRATARRLLHTLVALGYARTNGKSFELAPKVLDIGYAYLSSLDVERLAEPSMEALVEQTHESCSAAVLDGAEIVYVARVPTKRIMTIALGLGSRLPAYLTSMGRVLLAELDDDEVDRVLGPGPYEARTSRTVIKPDDLHEELARVRRQGWALVDQELEDGLRSIAAPLRDRNGRAIAAVNISSHAGRVSLETVRREFLPALLSTCAEINERLARR
ncbi:MAG: IclR family transcriptional regulator [Acidimicrobiales bacterium]|nr:IclR family transcriptional regulator [Acidimicrobiales bacterium]